jgi:F-type H+-transporting ATPase subunit epsilon
MAREFHLSVVAPDKSVIETSVVSVTAPGTEGYFGVQGGHLPLIAALKPGIVEYTDTNTQRRYVYVGGGFAEVGPDHVTVLADEAEHADAIDLAKAEQLLEEARLSLRGEDSTMNNGDALLELERALTRYKAARLAK